MASAIDSKQRLEYLQFMLASARAQTRKPDLFCVSIYVNPGLYQKKTDILQLFESSAEELAYNCRVKVIWQLKKKAQFVQYRELLENIVYHWGTENDFSFLHERDKVWLSFTDDDDLWHPYRMEILGNTIARLNSENRIIAIVAPQKTEAYDPKILNPIESWRDVNDRIKEGKLVITLNVARDIGINSTCIQLPTVIDFFTENRFLVYHNIYCSTALMSWTMGQNETSTATLEMKHWLYFCRRGGRDYSCLSKLPPPDSLEHRKILLRHTAMLTEIPRNDYAANSQYRSVLQSVHRDEFQQYRSLFSTLCKQRRQLSRLFYKSGCLRCGKVTTQPKHCPICKTAVYCSKSCRKKYQFAHRTLCVPARENEKIT